MKNMTRLGAAVLAAMLLLPAAAASATDTDRVSDRSAGDAAPLVTDEAAPVPEVDVATDRQRGTESDRVTDEERDRATDRDRDRVTDRRRDRDTDRCRVDERPTDCCEHLADATDRCTRDHIRLDDPHAVRALVHRLIEAGEWQKLVRLLHAIGII